MNLPTGFFLHCLLMQLQAHRTWPPHRNVGTPKRLRTGSARVKLVGGKGLR